MKRELPKPIVEEIDPAEFEKDFEQGDEGRKPLMPPEVVQQAEREWQEWNRRHRDR